MLTPLPLMVFKSSIASLDAGLARLGIKVPVVREEGAGRAG